MTDGQPLRLLHALAGAAAGGAEKFVVRLCLALARAGIEQRALIRGHPNWTSQLRDGGIDTYEAPFRRHLDLTTRAQFHKQIREFRPSIVLTHMSRASSLCPRGEFAHVARLGGYFDLKYYRKCDHLIGNTPDIRDYFLREGWPAERSHFISNFALETPPASPVVRRDYDTPEGAPLLVALGRLHEDKAFDVLLSALVELPDCHLWIAGEGPLHSDLVGLAKNLGVDDRLRFLGWVDDPTALFGAADACVMPSRWEPLGNVILEAWLFGIPMIAAASQGPSFLIDSETNGLLVPVDDANGLAEALRRLLGDPDLAARLVAGGRQTYESRFSEQAIVGQYVELFRRILVDRG